MLGKTILENQLFHKSHLFIQKFNLMITFDALSLSVSFRMTLDSEVSIPVRVQKQCMKFK